MIDDKVNVLDLKRGLVEYLGDQAIHVYNRLLENVWHPGFSIEKGAPVIYL